MTAAEAEVVQVEAVVVAAAAPAAPAAPAAAAAAAPTAAATATTAVATVATTAIAAIVTAVASAATTATLPTIGKTYTCAQSAKTGQKGPPGGCVPVGENGMAATEARPISSTATPSKFQKSREGEGGVLNIDILSNDAFFTGMSGGVRGRPGPARLALPRIPLSHGLCIGELFERSEACVFTTMS